MSIKLGHNHYPSFLACWPHLCHFFCELGNQSVGKTTAVAEDRLVFDRSGFFVPATWNEERESHSTTRRSALANGKVHRLENDSANYRFVIPP